MRRRVHQAIDAVLFAARDVTTRYGDGEGFYVEPPGIADGGDVTGVINAARIQVIERLQDALDRARAAIDEVAGEIEEYRRNAIGAGYDPIHRRDVPRHR